jgi:predicted ribosome quality control (RQC) complex YloA/Tae2 family protein
MYRDAEGNVKYTNVTEAPPKDAKKIRCFKAASPPPVSTNTPAPPQQSGENFPSVDRDTQRQRDAERQRILEEELATEQARLEDARQQLEEQESVRLGTERNYQRYLDRVQPFREAVETHQRNVQALQRELNSLR